MLDIVGNQLIYASEHGSAVACTPAEWLVGAEGNASPIRRSLGIPSQLTCLSHMAGILLEGAELPSRDYGHILMGAAPDRRDQIRRGAFAYLGHRLRRGSPRRVPGVC
jgi:2-polyprenyl-6-methoxyphenol hydroxylase-like FAD-dependent oxidoreductase